VPITALPVRWSISLPEPVGKNAHTSAGAAGVQAGVPFDCVAVLTDEPSQKTKPLTSSKFTLFAFIGST
jgi:hypothetical protein